MSRTINDALQGLPTSVQRHILALWTLCDTPDVYDGDLDKYMLVIEQETSLAFSTLTQTVDILDRLSAEIMKSRVRPIRHPHVVLAIKARRVFLLPATIEEARELPPEIGRAHV